MTEFKNTALAIVSGALLALGVFILAQGTIAAISTNSDVTGIGGGSSSATSGTGVNVDLYEVWYESFANDDWEVYSSGTGTSAALDTAAQSAEAQNVIALNLGTTTSGIATTRNNVNESFHADIEFQTYIQIETLPTAGEDFKCFIGYRFSFGTGAATAHGIYFYLPPSGTSNWVIVQRNNATETATTTGTALTTDWVELRFVYDASEGSTEFFVDDTSVGTVATNVPDNTDIANALVDCDKDAGTTSLVVNVDYLKTIRTLVR